MLDTDHYIALVFHNCVDGCCTQAACQDTVVSSRTTATLQVSEDSYADIVLRIFVFHTFGIVHGTTGQFTFGYQYDTAVLGFAEPVLDKFFQLVNFRTEFRDDGCFCSRSNSSVQCVKWLCREFYPLHPELYSELCHNR